MARQFGALLSELREGEQKEREKMSLIDEVELLVFLGQARTHRAAYKMVLERRAAPPEEPGAEEEIRIGGTRSLIRWKEFTPPGVCYREDEELLF
jgi:hypothetical protein